MVETRKEIREQIEKGRVFKNTRGLIFVKIEEGFSTPSIYELGGSDMGTYACPYELDPTLWDPTETIQLEIPWPEIEAMAIWEEEEREYSERFEDNRPQKEGMRKPLK